MNSSKLTQYAEPVNQPNTDGGELLLSHVHDFCRIPRPRLSDINTLKELFYALIGKTNADMRRRISLALAGNLYTPKQLVLYLAMEPVGISTPVLLYSALLTGQDLISLIERKGHDHALVIARRQDLTIPVLDKLAELQVGSRELNQVIAVNPLLKGDSDLQPVENTANDQASQTTAEAVSETHTDISDQLVDLAAKSGRLNSARSNDARQAARAAERYNSTQTAQILLHAARLGRFWQVADLIERTCGLNRDLVKQYIDEKNTGVLACLLFTLNIPEQYSGRLLLLMCPDTARNPTVFKRVMAEFSKLSPETAHAFFKQLDPNFTMRKSTHHIVEPRKSNLGNLLRERRDTIFKDKGLGENQANGLSDDQANHLKIAS